MEMGWYTHTAGLMRKSETLGSMKVGGGGQVMEDGGKRVVSGQEGVSGSLSPLVHGI